MKYKLHYGDGVLNLPSSVLSRLSDVDATTLKVLLLVAGGGNLSREKMAQEIGCDTDAITDALGYWRGAGLLISSAGGEKKAGAPVEVIEQSPSADKPTTKVADSAAAVTPAPATLPRYTTEELVALLDGLHFHTLCEQNSDDLIKTFNHFEKNFGKYFWKRQALRKTEKRAAVGRCGKF